MCHLYLYGGCALGPEEGWLRRRETKRSWCETKDEKKRKRSAAQLREGRLRKLLKEALEFALI